MVGTPWRKRETDQHDDEIERWRDAWARWPHNIAPVIAREIGRDPDTLAQVLNRYALFHLAVLMGTPGFTLMGRVGAEAGEAERTEGELLLCPPVQSLWLSSVNSLLGVSR